MKWRLYTRSNKVQRDPPTDEDEAIEFDSKEAAFSKACRLIRTFRDSHAFVIIKDPRGEIFSVHQIKVWCEENKQLLDQRTKR